MIQTDAARTTASEITSTLSDADSKVAAAKVSPAGSFSADLAMVAAPDVAPDLGRDRDLL